VKEGQAIALPLNHLLYSSFQNQMILLEFPQTHINARFLSQINLNSIHRISVSKNLY